MGVSLGRINSAIAAYANSTAGQKHMARVIKDYQDRGVSRTIAGSMIVDKKMMMQLANEFITLLTMKASMSSGSGDGSIPGSVIAHFASLYAEGPIEEADGSYTVMIKFGDNLGRPSLENDSTAGGVGNIVALFNNGVAAKGYTYGWWNGHTPTGNESLWRSGVNAKDAWIRSKKDRQPIHFMQDAVSEFKSKYGNKFNLSVNLDGIYEQSPGGYSE